MKTFSIDLEVTNERELFDAAVSRCIAENGYTEQEARDICMRDGEIDITACLVMLLDPGSLAGCDIEQSYVE